MRILSRKRNILKHKKILPHKKMSKETLRIGDIETEKTNSATTKALFLKKI